MPRRRTKAQMERLVARIRIILANDVGSQGFKAMVAYELGLSPQNLSNILKRNQIGPYRLGQRAKRILWKNGSGWKGGWVLFDRDYPPFDITNLPRYQRGMI